MSDHDHDPDDNSTGHEWDKIRELKNTPPKWWAIGFYAGLFFVTCYYIIYPTSPFNNGIQKVVNGVTGMEVMVHGHTKGIMHLVNSNPYYQGFEWTQEEISALEAKGYNELTIKAGDLKYQDGWTYVNEARDETAEIEAVRQGYMDRIETMSVSDILADEEMKDFALGRAKVLFGDNCAACHGSGGQGRVDGQYSFPNLTDDDWMYGGWPEKIVETITIGRAGVMPAKGGDPSLTSDDVNGLAKFVIALSTGEAVLDNAGQLTTGGESHRAANAKFQGLCFACHGAHGKGSLANGDAYTGAVNLTDKIWRFGGDMATVVETITNGRNAHMPTWGEPVDGLAARLDKNSIKILAVKVHSMGGGTDKPPAI